MGMPVPQCLSDSMPKMLSSIHLHTDFSNLLACAHQDLYVPQLMQ